MIDSVFRHKEMDNLRTLAHRQMTHLHMLQGNWCMEYLTLLIYMLLFFVVDFFTCKICKYLHLYLELNESEDFKSAF